MGIRQRGYWLRQADAIRRQLIAIIGYGVRIGMADSENYQEAMDRLELESPVSEAKADLRENMFAILKLLGGGKRV